jgi:serine/threonine protein kinase
VANSPLFGFPAIPGYEPIRPLGINGAIVYLARRSSSDDLVVLKVYEVAFAELVRHESLLARLDHPNILRVFEIGDFQGRPYCALEYCDGDLADRLRQGPLPRSQAIRLVSDIALAIQYARHQGVVPVSLAPNSILLAAESVPKLFEFEAMDAVGPSARSPEFMAPEEVAMGVSLTPATLVYRMGGVMYAVLTARPPFASGDRVTNTLQRVLQEKPVLPRQVNATVAKDLEGVCMKCLEKRPEDRYASLEELAERLAALDTP